LKVEVVGGWEVEVVGGWSDLGRRVSVARSLEVMEGRSLG